RDGPGARPRRFDRQVDPESAAAGRNRTHAGPGPQCGAGRAESGHLCRVRASGRRPDGDPR
nr:hypothetical protein [Tanacetum cinerariifolium]